MPISIFALFVTLPVVALTLTAVYFIRQESKPDPEEVEEPDVIDNWKKARKAGYWASSVVLAIVYMLAGAPKLTGLGDVLHRFSEWGYSEEFAFFIGASEFVAGIMLLIPKASLYAAVYLGLIMSGAIYTHLAFDTVVMALLPTFCLSFLFFIAYEDWLGRLHGSEDETTARVQSRDVGSAA